MAKLNKLAMAVTMAAATINTPAALADQAEIEALKQQLQALTARLEQMESKQSEAAKPATTADSIAERLSFSGLVEVESSYTDSDIDGSSSDVVVATVELGVEAQIADNVTANVVALYEEDDTDLEIDVATLTFDQLGGTDLALTLGQDYLPFGSFETHLVNDTLVLEAAEIRETAAILSWEANGFSAAAYTFNGDVDEGKDTVENFGASLGWGNDSLSVGADYISNVLDSDTLQDAASYDPDSVDATEAYILRAAANLGPVNLLGEYLETDTIAELADAEIEVLHLEAATEWADWTFAIAYQETEDADVIELPEERWSAGVSTEISEGVGLGIEYWNDEDYAGEESDNVVVQVAVEF